MTYTNWNYVEEYDVTEEEKGIIARCTIPKGSIIGIYDGSIEKFTIKNGKVVDGVEHKYIVQVARDGDTLYGLVTTTRDGVDYINHSCTPNITPVDRIILVAAYDIPQGERLTMDYTAWDFVSEGIRCWCEPSLCTL